VVEAVLGVSPAWCERGRWAGYGPKFIKLGRLIRYRKGDVLTWLEQYPVVSSTAETSAGLLIERTRARVQPVERRKAQPIEPAAA
jgi:predicted DNA-binding transcriptional regulator AlpA